LSVNLSFDVAQPAVIVDIEPGSAIANHLRANVDALEYYFAHN
jgi:hypothetical protein